MIEKAVIGIVRVGPETSHRPIEPETSIPFVVEVQTTNGPAVFQFEPRAAAVLAEEFASYMGLHSKSAS